MKIPIFTAFLFCFLSASSQEFISHHSIYDGQVLPLENRLKFTDSLITVIDKSQEYTYYVIWSSSQHYRVIYGEMEVMIHFELNGFKVAGINYDGVATFEFPEGSGIRPLQYAIRQED